MTRPASRRTFIRNGLLTAAAFTAAGAAGAELISRGALPGRTILEKLEKYTDSHGAAQRGPTPHGPAPHGRVHAALGRIDKAVPGLTAGYDGEAVYLIAVLQSLGDEKGMAYLKALSRQEISNVNMAARALVGLLSV